MQGHNGGVRSAALAPVIARHMIAERDPVSAARVNMVLNAHLADSSRYASALVRYTNFCVTRNIPMFPAESLWIAAYMDRISTSISMASMGTYLAAIRHFQVMENYKWDLEGDEIIRRMLRFLKKQFPSKPKALKFPLSIDVLRKIIALMPGWPNWAAMSHDDRTILAASVIGVCGFLRGGEFLVSPGSKRKGLLHSEILLLTIDGVPAVEVRVGQPKNLWWISFAKVLCFDPPSAGGFGPAKALSMYRRLSQVPLVPGGPAFVMSNGRALSRNVWVSRIADLLSQAKITFCDENGVKAKVLAASCRAGGVCSALDAGLSESTIKQLGRWRSTAWESYDMHNTNFIRNAMERMWRRTTASSSVPSSGGVIYPEPPFPVPMDVRPLVRMRLANRAT